MMRRFWCLLCLLALLPFPVGAAFAGTPAREPLVYYQLLYLSFLTRSACGDDIQGWPDNLRSIREILSRDLGYSDQALSAIEKRANDLRLSVPCDSEAKRDLIDVTMGETQVALSWFRTLKTARNP